MQFLFVYISQLSWYYHPVLVENQIVSNRQLIAEAEKWSCQSCNILDSVWEPAFNEVIQHFDFDVPVALMM